MQSEYKKGMLFEDYAAVKACHKSALRNVETAKHLARFENTPADSDALRFGRVFHEALFDKKFLDTVDMYSDQEWIKKADHPESIGINEQKRIWKESRDMYLKNDQEKESIREMAQSVLDNPLASAFLQGDGDAEASLFWDDKKTGLRCKTRLDWLRDDDIIVEIKTAANPEPKAFGKKIYDLGYHIGAWFNREGFREVMGRDIKGFVYIVIGKSAPHAVSVHMMNAHDFELGEIDGYPLMKRYQIIKQGGFNDYNQGLDGKYDVLPIITPTWELRRLELQQNQTQESEESQL